MTVFRFANLNQFQRNDHELLRHLCLSADVLLLVECIRADGTPLPIAEWLPRGWATNHDTTSEGRAGSCVCWRTRTVKARRSLLKLAVEPFIAGRRVAMRPRYISEQAITVDGRRYRAMAAHLAPARYGELNDHFKAVLGLRVRRPLRAPVVLGVDANEDVFGFARDLGLNADGVGIVGICTDRRRINVRQSLASMWGIRADATDHRTVTVTLERK